jgi:hypothetical protein
MAHQAQQFETYFDMMPDATFQSYGHGLITAILEKRDQILTELADLKPIEPNDRVSFIHSGNEEWASYRYRARIPAEELGATINDLTAGTLIFSKPQANELMDMGRAKARGQRVIVDFCDDHFDWPYYSEALRLADDVTCNTEVMRQIIAAKGRQATVIPDPYEYPLCPPHVSGLRLLWYGHQTNKDSLRRVLPDIDVYPLRIVSNFAGTIPWSYGRMLAEFEIADIVIIPKTEDYKSANRAIEATRQGCFVVAEPHPALNEIPGIWLGNIKEGIEWTGVHFTEANQRISTAQKYVTDKFSPKTIGLAWRSVIQLRTTSEPESASGTDGSLSIVTGPQTLPQTLETCPQ